MDCELCEKRMKHQAKIIKLILTAQVTSISLIVGALAVWF